MPAVQDGTAGSLLLHSPDSCLENKKTFFSLEISEENNNRICRSIEISKDDAQLQITTNYTIKIEKYAWKCFL